MTKAPYKPIADELAKFGRFGDTELVHLNPIEVKALESLSPTGKLTINPHTGQKEAFLPLLAPVLGSILGKAALGSMMSPLLAGAIGSGLGTLAVTRDPKQALMSGLLGYGLGGLGSKMGAATESAKAAARAGDAAKLASKNVTGNALANANLASGSTKLSGLTGSALKKAASGLDAQSLAMRNVTGNALTAATPIAQTGARQVSASALQGLTSAVKDPKAALSVALANPASVAAPIAIGAQGMYNAIPKQVIPGAPEQKDIPENFPKERKVRRPTGDPTRYGIDGGEEMFFAPAEIAASQPSISAPSSPAPKTPLELMDAVRRGRFTVRMAEGGPVGGLGDIGLLKGPGDGQSDEIPMKGPGNQDYLLADGEYVVPADAVSALGNGSTDAGARELDAMIARVRKEYYGSAEQPSLKNKRKVMSA